MGSIEDRIMILNTSSFNLGSSMECDYNKTVCELQAELLSIHALAWSATAKMIDNNQILPLNLSNFNQNLSKLYNLKTDFIFHGIIST